MKWEACRCADCRVFGYGRRRGDSTSWGLHCWLFIYSFLNVIFLNMVASMCLTRILQQNCDFEVNKLTTDYSRWQKAMKGEGMLKWIFKRSCSIGSLEGSAGRPVGAARGSTWTGLSDPPYAFPERLEFSVWTRHNVSLCPLLGDFWGGCSGHKGEGLIFHSMRHCYCMDPQSYQVFFFFFWLWGCHVMFRCELKSFIMH